MSVIDQVKHLPRWTWFSVAGLGIGYGVIHTWKNRASEGTASTAAADATGPGVDEMGNPLPGGTGYTGVVVPPTIISPPASDSTGLTDLVAGFDTLFNNLNLGYGQLYGDPNSPYNQWALSNAGTVQNLANQWAGVALAGSAPQPAAVNPTPIAAAPAPAPAAAPAACPAQYPFRSARGCYAVACKGGKRVHAYPGNIPDQYTGEKC